MTTYSRTELATRALRKANLVGAEETPSAADIDFANEGIASDTAALAIEGIYIVNGSDQAVPLEHLEPRAVYHAVTLKADFGLMSDVEAEQARELMKRRLRRLCVVQPTGVAQKAEYF
jgi:hypothetical protein